jgi:phage baseplate assembly protein W
MATYIDLDLSFKRHPGSKDVLKLYDVEAVKSAIKHIFLYNKFEKPFDPAFGMDIKKFLFEHVTVITEPVVTRMLQNQIDQYEPRCVIDNVKVQEDGKQSLDISVEFHVIGFPSRQSVNIVVERTR